MSEEPTKGPEEEKKSPLQEIVQPFIDLINAPRALWGINLAYVLEGMVYFGMLGYLTMHFSDFIFQGVDNPNQMAGYMVGGLTAGITFAMVLLGFVADKKGVRFALISAFILMLAGRVLISGAPNLFGLEPNGMWSSLHIVTLLGMLLVVIGYGMYQPAAYAGVRQFTTPKTAAMGFAMLYALMNLGGYLPSYAFLLRHKDHLNLGIPGTFWVYTGFSGLALICTFLILTRKTVKAAIENAKAETAEIEAATKDTKKDEKDADKPKPVGTTDSQESQPRRVPIHMWVSMALVMAYLLWQIDGITAYLTALPIAIAWCILATLPATGNWIAKHPLADTKFFFFIFALIPVQTLFTYNWLILPPYIERAFEGWVGEKFEFFANLNPILIFIAVPIIVALTRKAKVYTMMIWGTFIMAAPAFLLCFGPHVWTLLSYILIMTIGEAMWQPRFLQYAAEIAPEGRTGQYMGVAQLPWFLTKFLVPVLYSGWMMDNYCPKDGPQNTEFMWLIFSCIAMSSTVILILAKNWIGKDFKTKA